MVYGHQQRRSIGDSVDPGFFTGIYHVQYHQPPLRSVLPELQSQYLSHHAARNSSGFKLLPQHEVLCQTVSEVENV